MGKKLQFPLSFVKPSVFGHFMLAPKAVFLLNYNNVKVCL